MCESTLALNVTVSLKVSPMSVSPFRLVSDSTVSVPDEERLSVAKPRSKYASAHRLASDPRLTELSMSGTRSVINLPLALMVSVGSLPINVLPFSVVIPSATSVPEEASVRLACTVPMASRA